MSNNDITALKNFSYNFSTNLRAGSQGKANVTR